MRTQRKIRGGFVPDERKASLETGFIRWFGISDVKKGVAAYSKKDYSSALKAFGLGFLKLGTFFAACYGTYRWASRSVIHLNGFAPQAQQDCQSGKSSSSVSSSYPETGKQFVDTQLESVAQGSSAEQLLLELIQLVNVWLASLERAETLDSGKALWQLVLLDQALNWIPSNDQGVGNCKKDLETCTRAQTECKTNKSDLTSKLDNRTKSAESIMSIYQKCNIDLDGCNSP